MTSHGTGSAGGSKIEVLISEADLRARVAALGAQITRDYAGRSLVVVGVLKGSFVFMADLARAIDRPVEVDFMAVSSYGSSTKSSGVVRIVKDLDIDLSGRHVLLVEDIVDSGLTLNFVLKNLQARGPASLETVYLDGPAADRVTVRLAASLGELPAAPGLGPPPRQTATRREK